MFFLSLLSIIEQREGREENCSCLLMLFFFGCLWESECTSVLAGYIFNYFLLDYLREVRLGQSYPELWVLVHDGLLWLKGVLQKHTKKRTCQTLTGGMIKHWDLIHRVKVINLLCKKEMCRHYFVSSWQITLCYSQLGIQIKTKITLRNRLRVTWGIKSRCLSFSENFMW